MIEAERVSEATEQVTLREVVDWVSASMRDLADEDSRRSMKHRIRLAVERYAVLVAMLLEDQPETGTG